MACNVSMYIKDNYIGHDIKCIAMLQPFHVFASNSRPVERFTLMEFTLRRQQKVRAKKSEMTLILKQWQFILFFFQRRFIHWFPQFRFDFIHIFLFKKKCKLVPFVILWSVNYAQCQFPDWCERCGPILFQMNRDFVFSRWIHSYIYRSTFSGIKSLPWPR